MMLPIDKAKISAAKLRFCFSQFLWFNVSQRRPFPLDVGSLAGKMRSYPSGISLSCVTGLVTASITSYDQTTSCHEPVSMWHWRVHTRLYDQQPRPQPAGERALMRFYSDAKWISAIGINLLKIFIERRMRQSITSINILQNSNWNLYSFHLPMDSPPTAVSNKFDCDWESNNFKLNKIFVLVY